MSRSLAVLLAVAVLGGLLGGVLVAVVDSGDGDGEGGERAGVTVVRGDGGEAAAPAAPRGPALTAAQVYRRSEDAVVFITAQVTQPSTSPFGEQQPRGQATGSGFVVHRDGSIVTNAHVVDGADAVDVKIGDRGPLDAQIVGSDPSTDLALLRVEDAGAAVSRTLALGDSDDVIVGEPAYAIGNPFGLDRTLTAGVVSALQREITAPNGFSITGVIQTDASINPGNSGGPLLDAHASVIGVNAQILTGGGGAGQGNVGIGFAVPSNTVRNVIQQLEQRGRVVHAYLGVQSMDVPGGRGAEIAAVTPGAPAQRAGLRRGDVVIAFDGRPVEDAADLTAAVNAHRPGDEVELTVRRDGGERRITVTLGEQPPSAMVPPP